MEKVIRGFVWGNTSDKQRLSKVEWSKVTRPREEGGLGLRNLRMVNSAFGMKACWSLLKKPETLWGRLLCAKYNFDPKLGFDPTAPASSTSFWRLICSSWIIMRQKLVWALGTGKTVQFWNHRWVPTLDGPLSEVATQRIPDYLLYKTVDWFVDGELWDWSKFQHMLPAAVVDLIAAIVPPNASQGEDEVYWSPSSSGSFTIKSAYVDLGGQEPSVFLPWRRLWSWYGPQRLKMFFWLLLNNGVLVNEERARRQISPTDACSMCGHGPESSLHMLRDCLEAKRTWEGLLGYGGVERFFDMSLSLTDWFICNISSKSLMGSGVKWCTLFGVGCWQIWKKRCGFVFKGERVSPEEIIIRITNMAKNVEEVRMMDGLSLGMTRPSVLVGWRPPTPDILKLNTDASLRGGLGHAYGGGLIRDEYGAWRHGFVANVGVCS